MSAVLKPSELEQALRMCIKTGTPAYVEGPPGIGKTEILTKLTQDLEMRLIVKITASMDATDLSLVKLAQDLLNVHDCTVARWLYDACDGRPTVILFDEMPNGVQLVLNSLQKLINERMINDFIIPQSVYFVGAGNRVEDRAGANRLSTAMGNRFVRYTLEPDHQDWCKWAVANNIHPMVLAFIRRFPHLLNQFDPKASKFPSPRSWKKLSDLWFEPMSDNIKRATAEGLVGDGAAIEFLAFDQMFSKLTHLNPDAIIMNPDNAEVPTKPDELFAVCSALAMKATQKNYPAIKRYLNRLNPEYSVMATKDMIARDKTITDTTTYQTWCIENHELAIA